MVSRCQPAPVSSSGSAIRRSSTRCGGSPAPAIEPFLFNDANAEILRRPSHENSKHPSALTSGSAILTIGDFSRFLIGDRIGMQVELVPHLFATANNRPSGQRGLYSYWMNAGQP